VGAAWRPTCTTDICLCLCQFHSPSLRSAGAPPPPVGQVHSGSSSASRLPFCGKRTLQGTTAGDPARTRVLRGGPVSQQVVCVQSGAERNLLKLVVIFPPSTTPLGTPTPFAVVSLVCVDEGRKVCSVLFPLERRVQQPELVEKEHASPPMHDAGTHVSPKKSMAHLHQIGASIEVLNMWPMTHR
jgi:hypothetical protein